MAGGSGARRASTEKGMDLTTPDRRDDSEPRREASPWLAIVGVRAGAPTSRRKLDVEELSRAAERAGDEATNAARVAAEASSAASHGLVSSWRLSTSDEPARRSVVEAAEAAEAAVTAADRARERAFDTRLVVAREVADVELEGSPSRTSTRTMEPQGR